MSSQATTSASSRCSSYHDGAAHGRPGSLRVESVTGWQLTCVAAVLCCRVSSDGEELLYTEVWSTGPLQTSPAEPGLQPQGAIADLKARGNAAFKAGELPSKRAAHSIAQSAVE